MSEQKLVIPEIIVGLGNPEKKYEQTRHNIGFDILDYLAKKWHLQWQKNTKFNALFTEGITPNNQKIKLLKPLTYMNNSGVSVRAVLDWYKLENDSLLVIYDDLDLTFGTIRLRLSGSSAGHKGMKSIIDHVGGQNFPRLRFGIGKSGDKDATIGHVLGRFSTSEKNVMNDLMLLTEDAIICSLKEGVEKAMSIYNGSIKDREKNHKNK